MQQTHAPRDTVSVYVRTISLAHLNLEQKTDSFGQDDSNKTNSLTDLARVADRVEASGCNGRARLIFWIGSCKYQLCSFEISS
eukprot:9496935-Pyramimonas_sp.AAC.1